jgi:hemoglobin
MLLSASWAAAEHQAAMDGKKAAKPGAAATEKPLYDRLGGAPAIALVVDDFVERILVNRTLNANPAIKASFVKANKPALKFHATAQVCMVTGGPCKYTGRDMKESHKDMKITEKDWDAMVGDFKAALNKYNVPAKEQDDLVAIVATTKKDIVMQPPLQGQSEKTKPMSQK